MAQAGIRTRLASLIGPRGPKGNDGAQGEQGDTPELVQGTTTQVDAGVAAELELVKTGEAAYRVDARIPRGIDGDPSAVADLDQASAANINTDGTATRTAINSASAEAVVDAAPKLAAPLGGSASERFFTKLRQGTADAAAVIVGDSTGDAPYRWPREYALRIAAAFPAWTVAYARWDNATRAWQATETIQAGTNGRAVTIWNASVSGGNTYTPQAPDANPMITSRNPDVVFINHGHNEGSPAWTTNNTAESFHARYLALCEDVRRRVPTAGIVCIGQNPPQAGVSFMAQKTAIIKTIAAMRGYGFADCTQAYIDAGTPASLYEADLLHPNAAGGALMADTIWEATHTPGPVNPGTQPTSVYTEPKAANLLANGDFTTLGASNVPTGWAATRLTIAKDTTNYENTDRGYGLRLTSTGGGQAFLYQAVLNGTNIAQWRGRHVTLLARLRNNATAPKTTAGRVSILDGVQVVDGITDPWSYGGFVWRALTLKIADAATMLQVRIYGDYGTDGTPDITLDGAWLTEGTLPRIAANPATASTGGTTPSVAGFNYLSTIGDSPMAAIAAPLASVQVGAGKALVARIIPRQDMPAKVLYWWAGAASAGNYDIGIYTPAGERLWSKGSTPWPTVSTQVGDTVSPNVQFAAGQEYLIVIGADSTGEMLAVVESKLGIGNLITNPQGSAADIRFMRIITQALPLPATITPGTGYTPNLPAVVVK